MKLIHFLLLGALLVSCSWAKKSDKLSAIDEVYDKTIGELYRTEKFYVLGTSTTAMDEVKGLGIFFKIDRKMTLEEARKLFLKAHHLFLKNINESESLRPYLKQYPFPEKDVEIFIEYSGPEPINQQDIVVITNRGENLIYKSKNDNQTASMIIHQESLGEANRIFSENIPEK